jgi:mannan endo-1,4-beta-mannosidase
MNFSARFYTHDRANASFRSYIKHIINRRNTITGITYKDDPAIMSWQLANEPRPGQGEQGRKNFDVFSKWIDETAGYIKSLDPHHLVSTGNEGTGGCLGSEKLVKEIHQYSNIDYVTFHLWILNWGWFKPLNAEETYPEAEKKALKYIDDHIRFAEEIGKPAVIEEFGIPRDGHSYSPETTTRWRDMYLEKLFDHIFENSSKGGPLVGSNFWAWGGFGQPRDPEDPAWEKGDDFTGDPPQEPQGRNSVFASDSSTINILKEFAAKMETLNTLE